MTRWYQHDFHTVLAHRIVFSTIPRLPRFFHPPIAAVTALIFFLVLGTERCAVAANLHRVLGKDGLPLLWEVYRVFYSFCDFVVSYCYVPRASHAQLLSMLTNTDRGKDKIDECLAAGYGLIVWTAHLGNWEFGSRLLEMHGRPVNVARVVEDKPAEVMLRNLMANERLRIIDLRGGVEATMEMLQALRRNEIVAIQGDRVYQRFSADVPFFSTLAAFPLGPFLLSQVSGAPVLPGFVVRQGWLRYRVLMGDVIPPPGSTGDRTTGQQDGLRKAVRFLEKTLADYHNQWLNFYNFWPGASCD